MKQGGTFAETSHASAARRRLVLGVVAASVGVHVGAALLAGAWVIARHFTKRDIPAAVTTLPSVKIPPPEPVRAINPAAAMASAVANAAFSDKIQALRPGKITLPNLPKVPVPPVTASMDVLPPTNLLGVLGGGGAALSGGGLGGGTGTGVSFLGVQTEARRVVLMYDVSATVVKATARAGVPMERIRDETDTLISNLGVNTRFTLVEFARNYAFFAPELVPSTKTNREAAHRWLHTYFAVNGSFLQGTPGIVTGSPGFLVALESVFQLRPDCVFVISDGSMQRGSRGNDTIPIGEVESRLTQLQATLTKPADVFFIGVGVTQENERSLRKALLQAGGRGGYTQLRR